jgi:hypothetical protein
MSVVSWDPLTISMFVWSDSASSPTTLGAMLDDVVADGTEESTGVT